MVTQAHITAPSMLSARRALCSTEVTLDGQPAMIMGARNDFAHVAPLLGGPCVEFAWETVQRIVARDGAFKS